jgi:hypothetical protein
MPWLQLQLLSEELRQLKYHYTLRKWSRDRRISVLSHTASSANLQVWLPAPNCPDSNTTAIRITAISTTIGNMPDSSSQASAYQRRQLHAW